jgi:UDP:flavonoid glycosyltransferase YjiC (YdhE family)
MVPLARAFLARGDAVMWATGEEAAASLRKDGFEATAAGLSMNETFGEFFRRFPELGSLPPEARPAFMFPRIFGAVRARPFLDDLLPLVRTWKPDLLVRDASELAGPVAAAVVGIPSVTHSYGSLVPRARIQEAGEFTVPLWKAHGLAPRPVGGSYDHLYLDIYPPSLQVESRSHVPAVQLMRPVAYALRGDDATPAWLEERATAPLVYVTFGTVFNKDAGVIKTVVEGVRGLPVRVIVTVGNDGQPEALGPQPENVQVARYIPQTEILPACAAVVSHAGSGTFLAALSLGLPQLCLPQGADQFFNAAAGVRAGACVAIEPGKITVDSVREAAQRVLGAPELRTVAEGIADEMARMPDAGSVADILAQRYSKQS